ncbi:hypothetical protein ON010_g3582 [Phytophthora cinnamomi]|nr:hypothetical protein ON010_g3582 [Phytophthora cinnamomi]
MQRRRKRLAGRSRKGRRANLKRNFEGAYKRFHSMHFSHAPVYTDEQFRRRFRTGKELFWNMVADVGRHDSFFTWKRDATDKKDIQPSIKVVAALQMLAYGCSEVILRYE